jgi:hypothetical protein
VCAISGPAWSDPVDTVRQPDTEGVTAAMKIVAETIAIEYGR